MAIKVVKPGLATTVQDLGRPGYYHIGIPLSGGMDRFSQEEGTLAGRLPHVLHVRSPRPKITRCLPS